MSKEIVCWEGRKSNPEKLVCKGVYLFSMLIWSQQSTAASAQMTEMLMANSTDEFAQPVDEKHSHTARRRRQIRVPFGAFSPWAGICWKRIPGQRPGPLQPSAAYYRKILSLPPTARLVSGASPVICLRVPRGSAC